MNGYSIGLFLHIVGALGIFVALGLEWTGLWQIRSASLPEQVRGWMGIIKSSSKLGFAGMLTTVLTGIYMMLAVWGYPGWLIVSLGSIVLMIALSLRITRPRMVAIGQALAAGKGALSITFYTLANHPLLWISIQTRIAIALGIIFLKITKPSLGGSLLVLGAAIVLGLASTLPIPRSERTQEKSSV